MSRFTRTHAYLGVIVASVTLHSLVIANDNSKTNFVTRAGGGVSTDDFSTQPISQLLHQPIGTTKLSVFAPNPHDANVLSGLRDSLPIGSWRTSVKQQPTDLDQLKSFAHDAMNVPPVSTQVNAQAAKTPPATTERRELPAIPIARDPQRPATTVARGTDPITRPITLDETQRWAGVAREVLGDEPVLHSITPTVTPESAAIPQRTTIPESTAVVIESPVARPLTPKVEPGTSIVKAETVKAETLGVEPRLDVEPWEMEIVVETQGVADARGAGVGDGIESIVLQDAPIADNSLIDNEPIVRPITPFVKAAAPTVKPRDAFKPQVVVKQQAVVKPQVVVKPKAVVEPQVQLEAEPQVVVDAGSKPRGDLFPLPGVPTDTSTKIVGREADVEASASKQSTDDEKPPVVDAAPAPVISVVRPAKELNVKKPVDSGKHVNTNVADRVVDRNASDDFEVPQDVLVTPGQPPRRLPVTSSNRIDLVAKTCEQHIRYGRDLAARGATQSARQEYIEVLNRISQALDYDFTEPHHSKALAAGLTALHESRTFHSNANRLSTEIDVPTLVAIHRTPALKEQASIGSISPVMAQQRYLEYAKQQLVLASGGQPVASKALYSIARLESVDICEMPMSMPNAGPRAIALHQAALMVDARNYPAANELGVLFARYGQIETAKSALTMATRHSTEPEAWYNLAKVLEMEGSTQRAAQARNNYQRMRAEKQQASTTTGEASVRWVAPAAFSSSADPAGVGLYERSVDNEASPAAALDRGNSKSKTSSDGQAGSSPFQGFSRFFNRQEK